MSSFECSICLEYYNATTNVPTTFSCGHSCCLKHTVDMMVCHVCRAKLPDKLTVNIGYRDGAIEYVEMMTKMRELLSRPSPIPEMSSAAVVAAATSSSPCLAALEEASTCPLEMSSSEFGVAVLDNLSSVSMVGTEDTADSADRPPPAVVGVDLAEGIDVAASDRDIIPKDGDDVIIIGQEAATAESAVKGPKKKRNKKKSAASATAATATPNQNDIHSIADLFRTVATTPVFEINVPFVKKEAKVMFFVGKIISEPSAVVKAEGAFKFVVEDTQGVRTFCCVNFLIGQRYCDLDSVKVGCTVVVPFPGLKVSVTKGKRTSLVWPRAMKDCVLVIPMFLDDLQHIDAFMHSSKNCWLCSKRVGRVCYTCEDCDCAVYCSPKCQQDDWFLHNRKLPHPCPGC